MGPRDLYLLLRDTDSSPSLEELLDAFDTLSKNDVGVLKQMKKASSLETTPYAVQDVKHCVNKLRSLANAIEKGLL